MLYIRLGEGLRSIDEPKPLTLSCRGGARVALDPEQSRPQQLDHDRLNQRVVLVLRSTARPKAFGVTLR